MSRENPWKLKNGDRVRISAGSDFRQFAKVELIDGVAAGDRDHLHSSKWTGTQGASVACKPVSTAAYMRQVVGSSPKLKLGLLLTLVSMGSAYLTAAVTKDGHVDPQLGTWRWLLFALSVVSALGSWAKDLW